MVESHPPFGRRMFCWGLISVVDAVCGRFRTDLDGGHTETGRPECGMASGRPLALVMIEQTTHALAAHNLVSWHRCIRIVERQRDAVADALMRAPPDAGAACCGTFRSSSWCGIAVAHHRGLGYRAFLWPPAQIVPQTHCIWASGAES
jgi:hypothetical protein